MNEAYSRICHFTSNHATAISQRSQTKPLSLLVFLSFAPSHGSSNSKFNQVSTSKWNFKINSNFHVPSFDLLLLSEVTFMTHVLTATQKLPLPASSRLTWIPKPQRSLARPSYIRYFTCRGRLYFWDDSISIPLSRRHCLPWVKFSQLQASQPRRAGIR